MASISSSSARSMLRRVVSSSSSTISVSTRRNIHASALQPFGASIPPPLPPFARIPPRSEPMVENSDAVWDDGVAPELAIDFDAPHISKQEGLATWAGALFGFFVLYQTINFVSGGSDSNHNPALPHASDVIDVNYADHAAVAAAAAAKK